MYKDEFNVANFLAHPDVLIGQALTLRYKPVDLDVLPLYIVLVGASPLILWSLLRRPNLTLLASVVRVRRRRAVRLESSLVSARAPIGTSIRLPGSCCSSSRPGAASEASARSRP